MVKTCVNSLRMDREISTILRQNPALELIADGKKVKCTLTGHEMPCRLGVLESFIKSKKYSRLSGVQKSEELSKYRIHIVPSSKEDYKHQLFCTLTLRHLNNDSKQIENHIKGRRFQKAYARWQHCQLTGEKFVARIRQRHKVSKDDDGSGRADGNDDGDWEDVDEEASDVDSLSDLYPAADFERLDLKDDHSGYEFDMAMDNETGAASSKSKSADKKMPKRTKNANKRKIGQKKPKNLKDDIKAKRPRNND